MHISNYILKLVVALKYFPQQIYWQSVENQW